MITIVGTVADAEGHAVQWVTVGTYHRGRNFDVAREFSAQSSLEYRSVQPEAVRVDIDHDAWRTIGQVKYLERTERHLFAVAEIDGSGLGEGPWYFSPSIRHYGSKEIELRALAVTRNPASIGLDPIDPFPGELYAAAGQVVYQDGWVGRLIKAAYEYDRKRRRGEPLVIQGFHPQPAPVAEVEVASTRQRLEYRSATTVDISRARRELDLIIAPAESPTTIHERGRSYTEVISHGAFAGVEKDPGRIRVNRDHVRERVIGRALHLDPWDERGLTGTVKLARVADADEALALIDDGLLGVSVGFGIPTGGDEWHGTQRRRVRRAVCDHISLVVQPAYETAQITAVRSGA